MTREKMDKQYFVYILASKRNGTLYTGVTSDLIKRVYEHKEGFVDGFTKKYAVKNLVFYEIYQNVNDAIHREKCIKKWRRQWKINLIQSINPDWQDLYEQIV
jgi:putative endonuclease